MGHDVSEVTHGSPLACHQLGPLWTLAFANEVPTARTIGGGAVLLLAIVWLTVHPEQRLELRAEGQEPREQDQEAASSVVMVEVAEVVPPADNSITLK